MAYQSLYRRYRPQKFSQIKGQDHVVRALQGAVRNNQVGHAYLLHGPRGSGKTSTARVLAKALNCTNLGDDGEPCGVCESCVSIEENRSFDLQELDAASNNRVDDMRALLERVNLTTPGRAKVYLLDEVHMLTSGAENALLKTLEEPPELVTWVLATTEPHKVVQTIRSRCQVFELGLIDADVMSEHLRGIVLDAGLDVADESVDQAVSAGGGSVRDTLTALERIIAGGGDSELESSTDAIVDALAEGDRAAALAALEEVVGRGRDPRTIGELALAALRHAFLTAMGRPPSRLSEHERLRAGQLAERMTAGAITRSLEVLGRALIEMRQAPDPRIDIEVALIRLCDHEADPAETAAVEALARRVRTLEDRLGDSNGASSPPASSSPAPKPRSAPPPAAASAPAPPPPNAPASRTGSSKSPAAEARQTLYQRRAGAAATAAAPSRPGPAPAVAPEPPPPLPPVPPPDLRLLQPGSPSEVVQLAERHLGLDREVVIARATALEPDRQRRREPGQLRALWLDLVDSATEADDQSPADERTAQDPPSGVESAPSPAADEPSLTEDAQSAAAESAVEPAESAEPEPAEPEPAELAATTHEQESGRTEESEESDGALRETEEPEETDFASASEFDELAEAPSHAQDIADKIEAAFPGVEFVMLPDPDPAAAS